MKELGYDISYQMLRGVFGPPKMPAEARQHSLGYLVSEPGFYFEDIVLIDHRIRAVSEVVLFIDY